MKKTILGLAALTALAFVACKKNDSNESNAQKIIGKWQYVNSIEKATAKSTGKVVSDTTVFPSSDYVEFNANGYAYMYELDGTRAIHDTAQYKVNDNQLILTYPKNADTLTITSLTGNALSLYEKEPVDPASQYSYEYISNFKK